MSNQPPKQMGNAEMLKFARQSTMMMRQDADQKIEAFADMVQAACDEDQNARRVTDVGGKLEKATPDDLRAMDDQQLELVAVAARIGFRLGCASINERALEKLAEAVEKEGPGGEWEQVE